MPLLNRSADRFQRALEGDRITDEQLVQLVATSRHLVGLGPQGPAPDTAFVATLHERLMAEAARMPAPTPGAARAASARRNAARSTPMVVVVGRGLPRLLAGATASALLVGGVVSVASRSALPGEALYPVKGWIDGVSVRLADSEFDRGRTYLDHAQDHISDARELALREDASVSDINVALDAAIESVRRGQRALDSSYAATNDPQALIALRDFSARALPQIEALRSEVPAGALPKVGELEALLRDTQDATARRIAACGSRCNAALGTTFGPASLPSSASTTSGVPQPGATASPSGGASVPGPVGGNTPPTPGVSAGTGGVVVGGGGGGATLSTGGTTINPPTVSGSIPVVPSVTVSLPLPSATVGTGGVSATLPIPTLGPVTPPGATIPLP